MSYDISFYKRKENPVSQDVITKYLVDHNVVKENPENSTYLYQNERTGVYFIVEESTMFNEETVEEMIQNLDEFEALNITLILNNLRPDFFGKETSLFVDDFVKTFDLYMYADDSDGLILKPKENEIYQRWSPMNKNYAFIPDLAKNLSFYPLEKSNKLWEFAFHADAMQQELGEGCYVPNIFYLKNRKTGEIVVACTWTEHIPTVIPEVDYVLLNQAEKGFFRTNYKRGFVKYDTLMTNFDSSFEEYKNGGKIIREDQASKIGNIFNTLPFDFSAEDFEGVELASITNYK